MELAVGNVTESVCRYMDASWPGLLPEIRFVQPFETSDPGTSQIAIIIRSASLTARSSDYCVFKARRLSFAVWRFGSFIYLLPAAFQKPSHFYEYYHTTQRCYLKRHRSYVRAAHALATGGHLHGTNLRPRGTDQPCNVVTKARHSCRWNVYDQPDGGPRLHVSPICWVDNAA